MAEERGESSFNVRFLTVNGEPLTVIGPVGAIEALEDLLKEAAAARADESPSAGDAVAASDDGVVAVDLSGNVPGPPAVSRSQARAPGRGVPGGRARGL